MWQVITARAVGTSHAASGSPCQDRETYRIVDDADGGEAAIGVVCDGAGSAELVAQSLRTVAGSFIAHYGASAITPGVLRDWVSTIRERISEQAEIEGTDVRDFACTLVFVIAADSQTICAQIGDGAIILNLNDKLRVALWPENGEYANQTYFVTEAQSHDRLQVDKFGRVDDFILFSDGLQRLALDEAAKSAHPGFALPLLRTVRAAESLDATKEDLERFLQSDRINSKTDDDKSIVIACRVD